MKPDSKSVTLEELVEWQVNLAKDSYYDKINLDEYARKFEGNPNEAYHILDCHDLTISMTQNTFDKVFAMPGFSPKNILEILDLIHPNHKLQVFNLMAVNMANETLFDLGKDSISQVFMITNKLMILKTSTPLIADQNRHAVYVLEQYKNVTDLVPKGKYTWSYKGPNEKELTRLAGKALSQDCPLSTQELTVLGFVGIGFSSQQASDKLFVSKHTVDTHRRNILRKLNVENTAFAYQKAKDIGILA